MYKLGHKLNVQFPNFPLAVKQAYIDTLQDIKYRLLFPA